MHKLQSKHSRLKKDEIEKLVEKYNISVSQLPKISKKDPTLADGSFEIGDVVVIERKMDDGLQDYFRVVV